MGWLVRFGPCSGGLSSPLALAFLPVGHFWAKLRTSCKDVQSLVLVFTSQSEAPAARDRILEEHRGGAWPTFAVIFASPSIVRSMEQPLETRSPGPAM